MTHENNAPSNSSLSALRTAMLALTIVGSGVIGLLAMAQGAMAQALPFEAQVPLDGASGSSAGRLLRPTGVAVSPVNHRVYVADTENLRVSVFTAWGEFVKAFGWGVENGAAEFQICTTETGCQAGGPGSGPGQFQRVPEKSQYVGPSGIAVDSEGDVYALDLGNFRVQKFDAEGNFILTFGGKVNKTTNGNICTAASGNTCGAGEPGTEPGEFSIENVLDVRGDYVAVAPDDTVYVADKDRIQSFGTDGSFKSSFDLPEAGNPGALAVDPVSGDLLFAFNQSPVNPELQGLYRLSPTGEDKGVCLPESSITAVTVDPDGTVYAVEDPPGFGNGLGARILRLAPDCSVVEEFAEMPGSFAGKGLDTGVVTLAGKVDIYMTRFSFNGAQASVGIYGAVPDPATVGPPPKVPPEITEEFATSVGSTEAVLKAQINPFFWNDTRYYVEYGTEDCATSTCTKQPLPPGFLLTSKVTNAPVPSAGVVLEGLEPGTTYHYRFVAESGGGGPTLGADATFTTLPAPGTPPTCANDAFRTGFGASLPDCRAYEMVSPVDKKGADILTLLSIPDIPARRLQASTEGDKLTYSAYKAFGDAIASPYSTQYLPQREEEAGWPAHSITPPREGVTLIPTRGLDAQFKAFTPDLCTGWFIQDTDFALAPESVPGFANLYKVDLCGAGGYEVITRVAPPARPPSQYVFELQGFSADGIHTVFRANDKLTSNAQSSEAPQVYDYFEGNLRAVCVLPNKATVAGCSAGTAGGGVGAEHRNNVQNAVSDDGTKIFWTASEFGAAKLYVRINTVQTIALSAGNAYFRGAAADGSKAIFSEGGKLVEFELGVDKPEEGQVLAEEVTGVAAVSEDASRVYFVSKEAIDGGQPGQRNLYLSDEGAITYVATLSQSDFEGPILPTAPEPYQRPVRITPDGGAFAFLSNNSLTGRDSVDVNTGNRVSQVYLYDAGEDALRCVSCNRTGARPIGGDVDPLRSSVKAPFWAAGVIPTTESQLYFSRILSDDGRRIFFESFDALVPRDTNGTLDVYEWEADGKGGCKEASGCVDLISSGQSPEVSELVDADADGSDVFFTTNQSLLAQDPGLVDVYDARQGGGFPPPDPPPSSCVGEACQRPAPAPGPRTPASEAFAGSGNPASGPARRSCPKGKRRVVKKEKTRCARRHKRGTRNHKRGAAR
jgi:DNA-binding beta-propeller fold protein YncE